MEKMIQHFSHQHPLKLQVLKENDGHMCYGCQFFYKDVGAIYACEDAESSKIWECLSAYLCTLCAHLPAIIHNHPLHPLHPYKHGHALCLVHKCPNLDECYACGINTKIDSMFYQCDACSFRLHVYCAHSLVPTLRSRAHPHLLTLIHTHYERNLDNFWGCSSCNQLFTDGALIVRCVQCRINYHIYCYDGKIPMPDNNYELEEHAHPLSLFVMGRTKYGHFYDKYQRRYIYCDVCKKWDWPHHRWLYICSSCDNVKVHVSCPIQFPAHPAYFYATNSISICDGSSSDDKDNNQCQRCKKPILEESMAYGCRDHCKIFLDSSCFREMQALDEQIHQFHPQHSLRFVFYHGEELACSCCSKKCSGFIFRCQDCCENKFVLDLECMFLVPTLKHRDHDLDDHLLVLLDKVGSYPKTSYLRCVNCGKNFGLTRCILPYTILDKCHFHPLTLLPRLVEDDDVDQCYCDACEEKRDPAECIYYCRVCKFEVHIGCVKFEEHEKLEGVKFVTLQEMEEKEKREATKNEREDRVVFLSKDVLLPLSQVEVEEMKNVLNLTSNLSWKSVLGEIPSFDDKIVNKILYSDQPFKNFVNKLNSIFSSDETPKNVFSFLEMEQEVVRVGEYLVPINFEYILGTLFAKHGDFGVGCALSPKTKQHLFVGFCRVLQSIYNTKIVHVTEDLLIRWWVYFSIVQVAGFQIQFAFGNLKRIMYAHFGLQADKYADVLITSARKKVRELPQQISALRAKIKELTIELTETKETLHKVEIEENELREAAYRAKKSHFMRKCLMEAEDLVCFSGGELFSPPKE